MKKAIFAFFSLLMLTACTKSDGIYPSDNGWDCVYQGETYRYRCQPDGLYLYAPSDIGDGIQTTLFHTIQGRTLMNESYMYLRFRQVENDEYIYALPYEKAVINSPDSVQAVLVTINDTADFCLFRKDYPVIRLLERYIRR